MSLIIAWIVLMEKTSGDSRSYEVQRSRRLDLRPRSSNRKGMAAAIVSRDQGRSFETHRRSCFSRRKRWGASPPSVDCGGTDRYWALS